MGRSAAREAVVWGVAGALLFVVLALGYELFGGRHIDVVVLAVVTLVVGVLAAGLSYAARRRLPGGNEQA